MKKIVFIAILLLFAIFSSCTQTSEKKITNKNEYQKYLSTQNKSKLITQKNNLSFWENKLEQNPTQYLYYSKIAAVNSGIFSTTGNIDYLKKAEENLTALNKKNKTSSSLRALARNYISQHRFNESLELLLIAEKNGDNLRATQKMLFDVYLELGNHKKAESYLSKIKLMNDFDYLIRASKWNDTIGDLQTAITFLESALKIVEAGNNENLLVWTYTNLADFYGHNNEIQKSYNYYLKSLEIDSNNAYSLKGIAWIIYSYEGNPREAFRIISEIQKRNESPDYYLLKSEIAEYMGNYKEKSSNIQKYLSLISNKKYGVMYNAYKAELHLEYDSTLHKSIVLAKEEIKNRPTAKSYDLLAWATLRKGNTKEALSIVENHINGKTSEPSVMYHVAEIYKANGYIIKANEIKSELIDACYELGPLISLKVQNI